MYSDECIKTFLKDQGRLFDEPVAYDEAEAREFLEDCMAQVFNSIKEVREYLDDEGMDVEGMLDEELAEELEVFPLPSGKFLVVEA